MDAPKYPVHIIPEEGWKKDIQCKDVIALCKEAVTGRRIDGALKDCIDFSLGEDAVSLKEEVLPTDDIPNLSTSLLGTPFQLDDFHFRQIGNGQKNWEGRAIKLESFKIDEDYKYIKTDFFIVGWSMIYLNERPVPYNKVFNKKKEYTAFIDKIKATSEKEVSYIEEYENLQKNEDGMPYAEFNGKIIINHIPTNLNYWHFTIDLYPIDTPDKPIKDTKKTWREMMAENVADYLRKSFYILPDMSTPPVIPNWVSLIK